MAFSEFYLEIVHSIEYHDTALDNELGSTSLEGQVEGRNPAATQKSKEKCSVDVSKQSHFQAIQQLLQLVDTLIANLKPEDDKHHNKKLSSTSNKPARDDYVEVITNLMVGNGEVVAAVACGGPFENQAIISFTSPSKTPVRPQYTSYI